MNKSSSNWRADVKLPLTDRSSTFKRSESYRNSNRSLFPRLPSARNITISPQNASDLTARTLEACKRIGISPNSVLPIDFESDPLFDPKSPSNKNLPVSVLELRRTCFEKDRLTLLKEVDAIRLKLINSNWNNAVNQQQRRRIESIAREYAKTDRKRNYRARQKSQKVNQLLTKKWESEVTRQQQSEKLIRADAIVAANKRHLHFIDQIVEKTHHKNTEIRRKSIQAKKKINEQTKERNMKLFQRFNEQQKHIDQNNEYLKKQQVEFKSRQNMRFRQHQIQRKKNKREVKQYQKSKSKAALKKHKIAEENLFSRRTALQKKKKMEIEKKFEKIIRTKETKEMKFKQRREKVLKHIDTVDARMQEMTRKKQETARLRMLKSAESRSRLGIVKKKKEETRKKQYEKMTKREREVSQRLQAEAAKKQEEKMLRKELSAIMKRQRLLYFERQRKKDEYERARLEAQLRERDAKLQAKAMVRQKLIEKQRVYNEKNRLLRNKLSYKFQHLPKDKVISSDMVQRLSSQFNLEKVNIQTSHEIDHDKDTIDKNKTI